MLSRSTSRSTGAGAVAGVATVAMALAGLAAGAGPAAAAGLPVPVQHVVLISVDGLHAGDLARYVASHPTSSFATLQGSGTTYTQARLASISDSFPGLLSLLTGGTPRSTGVFYDDSYDRTLHAAGDTACTAAAGVEVAYDDGIDANASLDTSIDPAKLPRALTGSTCSPLLPNEFVATNTVFSVVHAAGRRTAWIDKHPAYQLVNGHGTPAAVDDLYTPEIDAKPLPASHSDLRGGSVTFDTTRGATDWIPNVESYDILHVDALRNELDGKASDGTGTPGVPALLGMNLQSVSVGQKLVDPVQSCVRNTAGGCNPSYVPGGYAADGSFTPQLGGALEFVDGQLLKVIEEIRAQGLAPTTEIVLTAKHGQSPVDPARLQKVDPAVIPGIVGTAAVAQQTADDVSLLWLTPGTDSAAKAQSLRDSAATDKCQTVYQGNSLHALFGDPATSPLQAARQPDILCQPVPGVVYTTSKKKVEEHGGLAEDDRHVALVVSRLPIAGAGGSGTVVSSAVSTTQVAPTVLRDLGLDPAALDAVRTEGTEPLPAVDPAAALPELPLPALLPLGGLALALAAAAARGRRTGSRTARGRTAGGRSAVPSA